MIHVFDGQTRLETWVEATRSLLEEDDLNVDKFDRLNVVLDIASPGTVDPLSSKALSDLDRMYRNAGNEPTHTIAEWIFPGWLYQRHGIQGVHEIYPSIIEEILESTQRWGTYAYRMVRRKDPENGSWFNPLKTLIEKMRGNKESGGGTFHSCYELGIHQGPFDIPLYDPAADRKRFRNLACLSHLSFKLYEGELHLTAFYRSHDYRFKTPGNLLGLARLQSCVALEVGASLGHLVVHSSRAYVNEAAGIPEFRELVTNLADTIESE